MTPQKVKISTDYSFSSSISLWVDTVHDGVQPLAIVIHDDGIVTRYKLENIKVVV